MGFSNVKITVLECKCYEDLQEEFLANPKSGPCPMFHAGDEFIVNPQEWIHLMNGKFCSEAWDCINRYVYSAMNNGSIMDGWTNDNNMMIACCNDGTRPVIFKIERLENSNSK